MILRMAYCFDVSLHDLLLGTVNVKMQRITLRELPAQAKLPITAQREDPERIRQAMLKFLADPSEPPLSMHQVAMRLGHAETFFLKLHPKLYCAIRDRYATYVREHKI